MGSSSSSNVGGRLGVKVLPERLALVPSDDVDVDESVLLPTLEFDPLSGYDDLLLAVRIVTSL